MVVSCSGSIRGVSAEVRLYLGLLLGGSSFYSMFSSAYPCRSGVGGSSDSVIGSVGGGVSLDCREVDLVSEKASLENSCVSLDDEDEFLEPESIVVENQNLILEKETDVCLSNSTSLENENSYLEDEDFVDYIDLEKEDIYLDSESSSFGSGEEDYLDGWGSIGDDDSWVDSSGDSEEVVSIEEEDDSEWVDSGIEEIVSTDEEDDEWLDSWGTSDIDDSWGTEPVGDEPYRGTENEDSVTDDSWNTGNDGWGDFDDDISDSWGSLADEDWGTAGSIANNDSSTDSSSDSIEEAEKDIDDSWSADIGSWGSSLAEEVIVTGAKENNVVRGTKVDIVEEVSVPSDLREFVKLNKGCDISLALKYFSKKDIDRQLSLGRVFKRKNRLMI